MFNTDEWGVKSLKGDNKEEALKESFFFFFFLLLHLSTWKCFLFFYYVQSQSYLISMIQTTAAFTTSKNVSHPLLHWKQTASGGMQSEWKCMCLWVHTVDTLSGLPETLTNRDGQSDSWNSSRRTLRGKTYLPDSNNICGCCTRSTFSTFIWKKV